MRRYVLVSDSDSNSSLRKNQLMRNTKSKKMVYDPDSRRPKKAPKDSTDLLLSKFEKEIKTKQKIDKKLAEKFVTRANRTYKKVHKKQLQCPLCNLRLDSNNNLVEM